MASLAFTSVLGVMGLGVQRKKIAKDIRTKGGDPRERGPVYARNATIDTAHIGLKKQVQVRSAASTLVG